VFPCIDRAAPHLQCDELGDAACERYVCSSFDDHVKLLFDLRRGELALQASGPRGRVFSPGQMRPVMHDDTPCSDDRVARTREIDFPLRCIPGNAQRRLTRALSILACWATE